MVTDWKELELMARIEFLEKEKEEEEKLEKPVRVIEIRAVAEERHPSFPLFVRGLV